MWTNLMRPELPSRLENLRATAQSYTWQDLAWSLGVIAAATIGGRIASWAIFRLLARWAKKTDTEVDDAVAKHMTRPLHWLVPFILLTFALPLVELPDSWKENLRHFTLVASITCGGWVLVRVVKVIEEVIQARLDFDVDDNLRARAIATQTRGFHNIAVFLIFLLTFAIALMTFEAVRQVGSALLASAGVAGLVIGFAAQKSIATILAGIQIALTQPIRVDDVVIVEGEWGNIEEITLTYVVVRIWDLRRLVVPISYFIEKPFQNWTRGSTDLLGTVELHVDYRVPVDAIREEFKRVLDASELWDGETWGVQVTAATDRAMVVRPLFSAPNAGNQWNLRCEVREKLIRFIEEKYPESLPRTRAELEQGDLERLPTKDDSTQKDAAALRRSA